MDIHHRIVHKRIRFTDKNDQPLANRQIGIHQKDHEFLFGCGGFDFIPFVSEGGEAWQQITDSWLEIFNFATLPFYWGGYEPVEGRPNRDVLMKTAQYLAGKGVRVKGHPLCWHTVCADWLLKYDNATILKKQLERIDREVTGFKGVVDMWDVINEVVIMPIFDKYDNAITRRLRQSPSIGPCRTDTGSI